MRISTTHGLPSQKTSVPRQPAPVGFGQREAGSTPAYLLVFDHGTTGIRACLMDRQGQFVSRGYQKFKQIYPKPGWVEHNANTLWNTSLAVAQAALSQAHATWRDIAAIAITNQRETVVMWDAKTGKPIHHAIVWQCRRTAEACDRLRGEPNAPARVQSKTGLLIDPYFSASKAQWLLDNVPQAKNLLAQGRLRMGTVDTWILWKLSGGKVHVTDPTNASRTMLYNIHTHAWDDDLLRVFGVERALLPEVQPSSAVYGESDAALTGGRAIPLAGNAGDQQAALYGQRAWEPGEAKSTYGTGAFLLLNTGDQAVPSHKGLLTTVAANRQGQPCYAQEGAVFMAGAVIEWLQKKMGLLRHASQADTMATSLNDNEGVYLVPAFVGLGAPYWDADARGTVVGMTQGTGRAHFVRAGLEAIAYQTRDVLDTMKQESHLKLSALKVDGGVTKSNFLMQFLADVLQIPILRNQESDITARGAGYLGGLATGFWDSPDTVARLPEALDRFEPRMSPETSQALYHGWQHAVEQARLKP